MRRYIGYREFVQRDQRSLVGTALLLTGSHEQAIRLDPACPSTPSASTGPRRCGRTPPRTPRSRSTAASCSEPSSAGRTALVRLPPRQRVLVVACLHDGRSRAEMATLLSLPLATVEAEITEAVTTLTKGNESRLTRGWRRRRARPRSPTSPPGPCARSGVAATGAPSSPRPRPSSRSASSPPSSCSSRERCGTRLWASGTSPPDEGPGGHEVSRPDGGRRPPAVAGPAHLRS